VSLRRGAFAGASDDVPLPAASLEHAFNSPIRFSTEAVGTSGEPDCEVDGQLASIIEVETVGGHELG
jgi:hypothetical protein